MTPEEKAQFEALKKQVSEMQSYILGLTGKLEFKNTIGRFAKEAVIQQTAPLDNGNPLATLVRTITLTLSGDPESIDIEVPVFPDQLIFLRDKDNNIYKALGYDVTL